MNHNPADDPRRDTAGHDVDESEVARLVRRYIDADDGDEHLEELRTQLDVIIQGEIVSLRPEGTEFVVVVECHSDDGEDSSRHAYTVRSVTDFDGHPALDWSYIGAQK